MSDYETILRALWGKRFSALEVERLIEEIKARRSG